MGEWIRTSDKEPPNGVTVLVAIFDSRAKVNMYFVYMGSRYNKRWFYVENDKEIEGKGSYVTHWMPMPDAPKEKPRLCK